MAGAQGATGPAGPQGATGATGAQNSFRNRLRNGNFAVNQRTVSGTVTLAAGAYGHDGWKGGSSGATYTFSVSGIDTTASISAGTLVQIVESQKVEGSTYDVSWAGTAQARVTYTASGASVTTTTAYAASPVALPATQPGTAITVEFGLGTLTLAQIEPGTAATVYERRDPGVELTICGYYLRNMGFTVSAWAGDGNLYESALPFPPMRVTPTSVLTVTSQTNNATGYPIFVVGNTTNGYVGMAVATAGRIVAASGSVLLSAEL